MPELKILRGLPASGKSRWATHWRAESLEGRATVSRDGFREMLSGTRGLNDFEQLITKMVEHSVRTLLKSGTDVAYDATNLRHREVRKWITLAEELGADWEVVDFTDVPIGQVHEQNDYRLWNDFENHVPDAVIIDKYERFVKGQKKPEKWEPLATAGDLSVDPYVPDESKPLAVIVDIDGTVAKMNGRSPYDYSQVGTDLSNKPILDYIEGLITWFGGIEVILVSGRPETCRAETEAWLDRQIVPWDRLLMRSEQEHLDGVRDDKVKLRLFNEHIRHNYNVHSVLDDRQRVVDMWRSLGLTVLQVDEGNF